MEISNNKRQQFFEKALTIRKLLNEHRNLREVRIALGVLEHFTGAFAGAEIRKEMDDDNQDVFVIKGQLLNNVMIKVKTLRDAIEYCERHSIGYELCPSIRTYG